MQIINYKSDQTSQCMQKIKKKQLGRHKSNRNMQRMKLMDHR